MANTDLTLGSDATAANNLILRADGAGGGSIRNGAGTLLQTISSTDGSGTVTMTAACGTSGTITLANNTLTYTKVGNTVYFSGTIDVASVSSPTGTLTLNGLPYAAGNNNRNYSAVSLYVQGGFASSLAGTQVQAWVKKNTTSIEINYVSLTAGTVGGSMANACQAGTSFTMSGCYFTT